MNHVLLEAANLQTFHAAGGLSPLDFVQQEMAPRGIHYEPQTLRLMHARILAAQTVNGLAIVILLRVFDKDNPDNKGFVTIAHDLTGAVLFRSGEEEGSKIPKSQKTGYREYGEVAERLAADPDLIANAIHREAQTALARFEHLNGLLQEVALNGTDSAQNDAEGAPTPAASISTAHRRPSRAQGARRE